MSRVAKNPITIPDSVNLTTDNNVVSVKGSKGELDFNMPSSVSIEVNENIISIKYDDTNQKSIALAGTTRSIINFYNSSLNLSFKVQTAKANLNDLFHFKIFS